MEDSVFEIPSYARSEAYLFAMPKENELYSELSAISEEILACRAKALQEF